MPPRSRRFEKLPATDQIKAYRPVGYIQSEICINTVGHYRSLIADGPDNLHCGCPDCQPRLWCSAVDEAGQRCKRPAVTPENRGDPPFCYIHISQLRRNRRQAMVSRLGALFEGRGGNEAQG